MNRYGFTITLVGDGNTPEEGWADAVDTLYGDTHFGYYTTDIETKVIEENLYEGIND